MNDIVKIAKNEKAILKIYQDDIPSYDPFEWNRLGRIVCFAPLGRAFYVHCYADPRDFLENLAQKFVDSEKALEILLAKADEKFGSFEVVPISYEDGYIEYIIEADDYNPFAGYYYDTEEKAYADIEREKQYWIDNYGIEELSDDELLEIIQANAVILPLYAYVHSGVTINTTGFSCPWDSGQVGWIYVTHEDIIKEFGSLDIEKAKELLKAEVEMLDMYVRGDVYGYVLEKAVDGELIDSCWGFYGLENLEQYLKLELPKEYAELVDRLEWAS